MAKVTINLELSTEEAKDVVLLAGVARVLAGTPQTEQAAAKQEKVKETVEKEAEAEEETEEEETTAEKAKAAKAKAAAAKAAKTKAAKEKAAAAKAKEAEEDEDLDGEDGDDAEVTIDQLRALLAEKVGDNRDDIKAKLTELGAKNIATLDLADYVEFHSFLNDLD